MFVLRIHIYFSCQQNYILLNFEYKIDKLIFTKILLIPNPRVMRDLLISTKVCEINYQDKVVETSFDDRFICRSKQLLCDIQTKWYTDRDAKEGSWNDLVKVRNAGWAAVTNFQLLSAYYFFMFFFFLLKFLSRSIW